MERRKFEDAFRDAFKGAEVNPSEKVWTNIELDLEKAKGKAISRKLVFYKLLAAASITFALGLTGLGYFILSNNQPDDQNALALNQSPGKVVEKTLQADITDVLKKESNDVAIDNEEVKDDNQTEKGNTDVPANSENEMIPEDNTSDDANLATHEAGQKIKSNVPSPSRIPDTNIHTASSSLSAASDSREQPLNTTTKLPPLYTQKEIALNFEKTEADPVALMFARLQQREEEITKEAKKEEAITNEKLWTSVGFAAGTFNPGNTSISQTPSNASLMASNSAAVDKQTNASGVAYSIGVSVGTQLNKRWLLQGGVNFLTQNSNYTATNAVGSADLQNFKPASLNEWRSAGAEQEAATANKIVSTAPYSVNNNVQFISVPMQAGYLIVNRKVGLQLNAGVSTDLFLQNTVTPEGGNLEKSTQGRGEDSPYRSVNFSGLVGTEVSYRFSSRYRVALNPGFRYPFSSIYKSDLGVNANPFTFDIGLRFRYIFK